MNTLMEQRRHIAEFMGELVYLDDPTDFSSHPAPKVPVYGTLDSLWRVARKLGSHSHWSLTEHYGAGALASIWTREISVCASDADPVTALREALAKAIVEFQK